MDSGLCFLWCGGQLGENSKRSWLLRLSMTFHDCELSDTVCCKRQSKSKCFQGKDEWIWLKELRDEELAEEVWALEVSDHQGTLRALCSD